MKVSAKYIICAVITVIVIVAVVFLPYLYYYAVDVKNDNAYTVESFSLKNPNVKTSLNALISLMNSDKVIWIAEKTQPADDELCKTVKAAINQLSKYLSDDSYTKAALAYFLDDKDSEVAFSEAVIASGAVGDTPVSAPLLYVELTGSDFYITKVLINRETNKIYQLEIFYDNKRYYDDYGYAMTDEEIEKIYNYTHDRLYEYLQCDENPNIAQYIETNNFGFCIFNSTYFNLRYNSDKEIAEFNSLAE